MAYKIECKECRTRSKLGDFYEDCVSLAFADGWSGVKNNFLCPDCKPKEETMTIGEQIRKKELERGALIDKLHPVIIELRRLRQREEKEQSGTPFVEPMKEPEVLYVTLGRNNSKNEPVWTYLSEPTLERARIRHPDREIHRIEFSSATLVQKPEPPTCPTCHQPIEVKPDS